MSQTQTQPNPSAAIDVPTRLEAFLDEHARKVVLVLVLVLAIIAALVVRNLLAKQREAEAGQALVAAVTNEDLRAVSSSFPGSPAATSAMILLADNLMKAGDSAEAATTLRSALALAPAEPLLSQARLALGLALAQAGEKEQALAEYDKVLKSGDASGLAPLALIYHGELLEKSGDLEAARARFEQVGTDFPESSFSIFAAGIIDRVGFVPPTEVQPPPVEIGPPDLGELSRPIDTILSPSAVIPGLSVSLGEDEEAADNEEEAPPSDADPEPEIPAEDAADGN